MSYSDWCATKVAAAPQFQFWFITLQLELLLLGFLRSLREGYFQLYLSALSKIVPWFFALDHTNYARWLPVHLRDTHSLKDVAPDVALQFDRGKFVLHKTTRRFSGIAMDQANEQNNSLVKGDGGAVGLTENPQALRRPET